MAGAPPSPAAPSPGGVSASDQLTVQRQILQAINNLATTYLQVQGAINKSGIAAATLVRSGAGRLCTISVTTAGSSTGAAYDSTNVAAPLNEIYVIPEAVGLYVVNLPVGIGLVIVPGTSQVLTVSYS
jgi:hypothetical protein